MRFDPKDPSDVLDYTINFTALLEGDETITTASFVVSRVTLDSSAHSNTSVTFWLSGGTPGDASVAVTITTSQGRTYERTAYLLIRNL